MLGKDPIKELVDDARLKNWREVADALVGEPIPVLGGVRRKLGGRFEEALLKTKIPEYFRHCGLAETEEGFYTCLAVNYVDVKKWICPKGDFKDFLRALEESVEELKRLAVNDVRRIDREFRKF